MSDARGVLRQVLGKGGVMRSGVVTRLGCHVFAASVVLSTLATAAFAQGPTSRADFNGDGFDDLAIGTPGSHNGAGGVHVLYGSAGGLTAAGNQFLSQNSAGISGGEEPDDNCGASLAAGDFNGDGFSDLAFGCPGEALGSVLRAGVVIVLSGSATGFHGSDSRFWHQDSSGVSDDAETDDRCGTAVAAGDFNNDGRADLAWGCPGETFGAFTEGAGAVNVLYGSATGLSNTGDQFWSQASPGVSSDVEGDDRCGSALVAADFNGDGRSDLAIGCPGEDLFNVFPLLDAGMTNVLFGSASGLTGSGSVAIDQYLFFADGIEAFDQCGAALGAGDIDDDGHADLMIGCPGEDYLKIYAIPITDIGVVHLAFGTATGFGSSSQRLFGFGNLSYRCGAAVAAGDFNGDGFADVAWGCPGATIGSARGAGEVRVAYGSITFEGADPQVWSQATAGIGGGAAEAGDAFGAAVAAGDFNGDGFDDLAIGVPREDVTTIVDGGSINVIYGAAGGLSAAGNQVWTREVAGIIGVAAAFDQFGFALTGSGGTAAPGLTGTWADLTQTCHGKDDDACVLRGTFTASNPSTQSTPRVLLRFFLSADQTLDADDLLLDEVSVRPLAIGQTQERKLHVKLPYGVDATGLFVIAFIDAENIVIESNEANNIVAFGPIQ